MPGIIYSSMHFPFSTFTTAIYNN